LLYFLIIVKSFKTNSTMVLGFESPSHPTWASLGQFFMMNQYSFSIPSLNYFKLVMTFVSLKICYILICDPTMLRIGWARKATWGNYVAWFAQQTRRFSIFIGRTNNCQYNRNLFFKVDMITSSFDIIYSKNRYS
jgi:hypothetical protein